MVFTSYFAKLRALNSKGIVPISIACYKPKWFKGWSAEVLAPHPDLLIQFKTFHNEEAYADEFRGVILANLNPHKVVQDLQKLAGKGKDFALLCYENPTTFCHRHLVADWLNENGIKCVEFTEV